MSAPDWKPAARIRASGSEWRRFRIEKLAPCRVCEGASGLRVSLHHLVPRSQSGDDTPDNLIPLCGDGTTGCHGLVEAHDVEACLTLLARVTDAERAYALRRMGDGWLDRHYSPKEPYIPKEKAA